MRVGESHVGQARHKTHPVVACQLLDQQLRLRGHADALSHVIADAALAEQLADRAIVVRRLSPLPIEAVVRGYLIGSGWRDYEATGTLCGISLPEGLPQAAKLPATIFTPATKAAFFVMS